METPSTNVNVDRVLATNALLDKEVHRLLTKVRRQERELATLRGQDPDQAELALLREIQEIETQVVEGPLPSRLQAPTRGHGPRKQPELEEREVLHEIPAGTLCSVCGESAFQPMGDQSEDSEEITIELRRVVKLKHRRRKYRCRCNASVVTAPGPRKLVPGGRYSTEFAVAVSVAKVVDHLPLHRQVRQLKRGGLCVTRQTLWDQERALARVLEPTYQTIREEILRADMLHADETRFLLTGRSRSRHETLWVLSTQEFAWYRVARKHFEAGQEILGGYEGIAVVDGYRVYEQLARDGPLRLAHCWAHVLRKFRDIQEHRPKECREIMKLIGKLYRIEGAVGERAPGDLLERRRVRQKDSVAVLKEIKQWALSQTGLPRSDFIKAIKYMLERWEGLTRFLEEPRLPLDNNRAENALRGPVLGRRNYLQFRSRQGCEVGAILFSLCESARLQGVPPHRYLRVAAERAIDAPGHVTLPADL